MKKVVIDLREAKEVKILFPGENGIVFHIKVKVNSRVFQEFLESLFVE